MIRDEIIITFKPAWQTRCTESGATAEIAIPRALAPQVAAALWPEVVEVLQKLLPIAERMQHACDSGETYSYDNDWDMADSMHYQQIIAQCQALLAALTPGEG